MKKCTLYLLLMLSIFSCFRKKSPGKKDVKSELERMFPGQFEVLDSNLKMLDVMAQFKGEKQALVGDKADPDVQFLLDWNKGAAFIGFDSSTVMSAHERAQKDVAHAREWFKGLKDKGLERFSLGVIDSAVYIQVFAEPVPALRKRVLETLQSALKDQKQRTQNSVFIELLEPEAYHKDYQDIIPFGHWKTGAGMQRTQLILTLNFEVGASMDIPELMRHWEINTAAKRLDPAHDEAFQTARAWAEKNLPKPIYMSGDHYYSTEAVVSDEPAVRLAFPYYDKELTEEEKLQQGYEATGYVAGTYYFDQKVFTKLRKQEEF